MKQTRPVMRYHGGKYRLARWIVSHFPPHRIYTEAYMGAASVLMHKPRCYAEVVNDLDGDVVNLFRVLRDAGAAKDLTNALRLTPFARDEFQAAYALAPNDSVEQARRLIVRAYMGFGSAAHNANHNTGFRANTTRSGTTPAHDWAHYPDAILAMTARLQGVVIENRDALVVIAAHDGADTLHYVDPPYVHSTRQAGAGKNGRYTNEMNDDDHRALAAALHSCTGMVVLSGYPSPLYGELYAGWYQVSRKAFADGAAARTECLWLNPAAVAAQTQCRFSLSEEAAQ